MYKFKSITETVMDTTENFCSADANFLSVTEKLDGCNTMLYDGEVWGRDHSTLSSKAPWHAMAKKHHGYKTKYEDLRIYGEDLYGLHTIKYAPIKESKTFRAFMAVEHSTNTVLNWFDFKEEMNRLAIPIVPEVGWFHFSFKKELNTFIHIEMKKCSMLGAPMREGIVIRTLAGFAWDDFDSHVRKYGRDNHVQPDSEHWRKNWQVADIIRGV